MNIETILRLEVVSTNVTGIEETVRVVLGLYMVPHTVPGGMLEQVADSTDIALVLTGHHIDHEL